MDDSTNEKSAFLKDCIADAFFKLLKKKSINKITVDEIVKCAGVGRMTYFRNFTSKYEIIFYKLDALSKEYYSDKPAPQSEEEKTRQLIYYIYSVRDKYSLIHKQSPLFILLYFASKATPDEGNTEEDIMKTAFYIYGFTGLICKWCEHDFKESPEEIFDYIKKWNILNVNPL